MLRYTASSQCKYLRFPWYVSFALILISLHQTFQQLRFILCLRNPYLSPGSGSNGVFNFSNDHFFSAYAWLDSLQKQHQNFPAWTLHTLFAESSKVFILKFIFFWSVSAKRTCCTGFFNGDVLHQLSTSTFDRIIGFSDSHYDTNFNKALWKIKGSLRSCRDAHTAIIRRLGLVLKACKMR